MKKKVVLGLIVILFYIGIPLSIYFNIIDFKYRFTVLTVFGIMLYLIARLLKYSNLDLGITFKGLKKSFIRILPITAVGIVFTFICIFFKFNKFTNGSNIWFYIFYVFISCPIQELLYRGILNKFVSEFKFNNIIRVVICSLLFCFIHIMYRDLFTLLVTFIIGVYWQINYDKDKCLFGVVFSHIVLGIITIFLGIID